jgi:two-component system chemotaxis sensor kinase CheA
MKRILSALLLPPQVTEFERKYLERMNRVGLLFFALHLPVFATVAYFNDTRPLLAVILTLAVLVGPAVAYKTLSDRPRTVSVIYGFTAMLMGGLLVHFGQGPMQIEMHFYFFALLAMLAVYGNPVVILVATATVALHHLALWAWLPSSVFNYSAPVWVVMVHASFVVLEAIATCFIARSFFDNVIGLEKIIEARTEQLDASRRDMRLVLDNVAQGFVTLGRDGTMSAEKSTIVEKWFGASAADASFAEYVGRAVPGFAASFALSWEQVIDGFLPLELTLDQLPKCFARGEQRFRLEYTPILANGELQKLLVVVSDVTAAVERERLEEEQREVLTIFDHVLRDKAGFLEYLCEADELVSEIARDGIADLTVLKRIIHTLKGNSSLFGIHTISDYCHELESRIAVETARPTAEERRELKARWNKLRAKLDALLGERKQLKIEIEDEQYEAVLAAVLRNEPRDAVAKMISSWKLEPTARRLARVADQARGIASRLNKGSIQVAIDDHALRLDPERWGSFWSAFVHVVRNAVDHGLESPNERCTLGKSETGRLSLSTRVEQTEFVVEIGDDGRGIDWAAVAAKARTMGIACDSHEELVEAVFRDGVTTTSQVSEFSGRGIGMGAIRSECLGRGGKVRIRSEAGGGTHIEFRFPKRAMSSAALKAVSHAIPC